METHMENYIRPNLAAKSFRPTESNPDRQLVGYAE